VGVEDVDDLGLRRDGICTISRQCGVIALQTAKFAKGECPALPLRSPLSLAKRPDYIGVLLQQAAKVYRLEIPAQLRADYDINDWLKGIKLLGGDWVEGEKYEHV
jgi:hypothetical protein